MSARSGLVITNGYYKNPRQEHQVARLIEEAKLRGVTLTEKKNNAPHVTGDVLSTDFVIFLDKDLAYLEDIRQSGIPVYNGEYGMRFSDDKALTAVALLRAGIPCPKTVAAPKCYGGREDDAYLTAVYRLFGEKPVIVKECKSSLGMGVHRAENAEELVRIVSEIGAVPHLFQEEVTESLGQSIRVYVAGGRIVGAMSLTNGSDFRSNAELGGTAANYVLNNAEKEVAERTAAALGLTFCGVDLFRTVTPLVIEVNSNAYFEAFERVTGANAAAAIIEAILDDLSKTAANRRFGANTVSDGKAERIV